jgi:GMP synthase (glutamine-hydrolysing)
MSEHVQGRINVDIKTHNPLTDRKATINVYESHAYCVARLPPEFTSLASSSTCQHEIFSHSQRPVYGTQFHPEKSGIDGDQVLERFATVKEEGFYLNKKNM